MRPGEEPRRGGEQRRARAGRARGSSGWWSRGEQTRARHAWPGRRPAAAAPQPRAAAGPRASRPAAAPSLGAAAPSGPRTPLPHAAQSSRPNPPRAPLRAHEPRFGTEDNPIVVPSLLGERIIGVTDPQDDTLVIWGIVREGEPPKQLVAGGEFFTLKKVRARAARRRGGGGRAGAPRTRLAGRARGRGWVGGGVLGGGRMAAGVCGRAPPS